MARMSVDDSVLRDPRIDILAELTGWSRRETLGCLLEIWAICYDRVDYALGAKVVDMIAKLPGFADLMVQVELATNTPSGKYRISGAKERITYLANLKQWGKEGGIKSAESRWNDGKGSNKPPEEPPLEGAGKPPDKPPHNPPVPDPVLDPPPASPKPRARKSESPLPADWKPTPEHAALASERGADLENEARAFRAHAEAHDRRCVRWNAAFTQWLLKSRPSGPRPPGQTRITATTSEYDEPPQPVLAEILR